MGIHSGVVFLREDISGKKWLRDLGRAYHFG